MSAFAAAVDLGFRYVETDVHATADDVVIAFHDPTLDRVTDSSGAIRELGWQRVASARIGGIEPIPRLEDVLGSWPDLFVNIDIKDAAVIGPLARVIERTQAHGRICLASFSDRNRRAVVRRLSKPVATAAGRSAMAQFRAASSTRVAGLVDWSLRGVQCLQVPTTFGAVPIVTARTVAAAHRAGRQVHVWTINEADEMHRLLDLGVDGIISDRADILRDVLRSRSAW